jgi:predicted flap endonuclease-1-like 5' DNA nuclease
MDDFMQDPVFYWLVWGVFTVAGIIIGWSLRAALPERNVRNTLERTEQEKNTLARLYTHLKHQHELREADFKKVTLELGTMRQQFAQFESDQSRRQTQDQSLTLRAERAEANAAQYAQKVAALELLTQHLNTQNDALTAELNKMQEELEAWQLIYQDFQRMQQKMASVEQAASNLESERARLHRELEIARIEIENLQLEQLQVQQKAQPTRKQSGAQADRKGGPAAPEHKDDLKIINGITPFSEQQLYVLGIYTFEQISKWDDQAIVAFAKALNISPGKIYQEDWVGQARHLVASNG